MTWDQVNYLAAEFSGLGSIPAGMTMARLFDDFIKGPEDRSRLVIG